jgi:SAM-dependent methyltransferase
LDHGTFGRIVDCRRCGLRFRNPREDDATILAAYADVEDPVYLANEGSRVLTFERSLDRLEAQVSSRGALVDVGCYTGVFLDVAARRGWRVTGVEPSRWASEVARRRGHAVRTGTLAAAGLPASCADVVTLWDVLEHCVDPLRDLIAARELARPGGYLALSTVNVDAWIARVLGRRWPWYMRMHLCYFTPATLRTILRRAGWRPLALERYVHVVSWDYLFLKVGRRAPRVSRLARGLATVLRVGDRTVSFRLGDMITAYAVKEDSA